MLLKFYIILLLLFTIGGIITGIVNKNKDIDYKKKNWLKYFVYLFIVNGLVISIIVVPDYFYFLSIIIILFGVYEISKSALDSNKYSFALWVLLFYCMAGYLFFNFSKLDQQFLFYTIFTTTVFDAFSQLSGQLLGSRKLLPKISPNKTFEGLLGGLTVTLITSISLRTILELNIIDSIFLGTGIAFFSFLGDIMASYCKRRFGIKDFSKLIPGHGGFMDRFDSLLLSGSFMYIFSLID